MGEIGGGRRAVAGRPALVHPRTRAGAPHLVELWIPTGAAELRQSTSKIGVDKWRSVVADEQDTRALGTLIRQFRELDSIKSKLIRAGMLNADATLGDVEAALKKLVPADAFGKKQPKAE